MATRGEAASYSNEGDGEGKRQYAQQPQMKYPPQAANSAYELASNPKYQQPPPNYGQDFQNTGPPIAAVDGKSATFEQTFKINKPKFNDLWAGILVRLS